MNALIQAIIAMFGGAVGRVLTFAMGFVSYMLAKRIALASGYILVSAALFGVMAASVKAAVLGVRVLMPVSMSAFTYFLPSSINLFLASLVTVRLTHFVWRWTVANLGVYTNVGGHGEGTFF